MHITARRTMRGDTIVEVLIAIAVAAFAIGTSYGIANRSLQRAISARERNEAINNVQSQISALKFREKTDPANFDAGFAAPAGFSGIGTALHFCLDPNATGPSDPNWPRIDNNFGGSNQPNNLSPSTPGYGYNDKCKSTNGSGTDYFIDISAQVTAASQLAASRTIYKVAVRWPAAGSGVTQQSVVFYRF